MSTVSIHTLPGRTLAFTINKVNYDKLMQTELASEFIVTPINPKPEFNLVAKPPEWYLLSIHARFMRPLFHVLEELDVDYRFADAKETQDA